MFWIRRITEISPEICLGDIEVELIGIYGIISAGNTILVIIIPCQYNSIKFIVKNMFPFQVDIFVLITVKRIAVKLKAVVT